MAGKTTINELAVSVGLRGPSSHRIAEPGAVRTLPVVDNSIPTKSNVRTSIDCYVSGQYVQKNGAIIEVTQRYNIFVSYANDTQLQTMQQVRSRIVDDFESRYGTTFNITNIFVPDLPIPASDKPKAEPMEMYRGSSYFKEMARYERMRYDIGTERIKSSVNISNIKRRYGYR